MSLADRVPPRASIRSLLRRRRRWALLRADCLRVLPSLPAGCLDAVVVDPPYGIALDPHWSRDGRPRRFKPIANDERPFVWFLYHAARALRRGGALLCFCAPRTQEDFRRCIELAGLRVRSHVIWDRVQHSTGDTAATFGPQHDVIWFATAGPFRFRAGRPRSVFRRQKVHYTRTVHPTEKPVDLLVDLIRAVAQPGELVCDPCAGSGSTGEAALQAGCRFLGMELDPAHARTALARLRRTSRKQVSP